MSPEGAGASGDGSIGPDRVLLSGASGDVSVAAASGVSDEVDVQGPGPEGEELQPWAAQFWSDADSEGSTPDLLRVG